MSIFIRENLRYILAVLAGFVLSATLLLAWWSWSTLAQVSVVPASPEVEVGAPAPTPTPKPPYDTYLLLGYGGGAHDGGLLTDTLISVFIDHNRQHITMLSLPRDLWVSLPTNKDEPETGWKINAAYPIGSDDRRYSNKPVQFTGPAGGGQMAKHAVEQVLGIPMEHFVAIDFTGFKRSIDILGGVEVRVDTPFTDPWYPLPGEEDNPCEMSEEEIEELTATASAEEAQKYFPCRYETLEFERGLQLMDGDTALKYVRSRHSPQAGNDFNRSQRQRGLLVAVKNRVLSIGFLPRAIPFINTLAGHVQTDLGIDDMQKLVSQAGKISEYEIVSLALTDRNWLQHARSSGGQYTLIPTAGEGDFSQIHAWLEEQLASESASVGN